ncbi:hypothetical protein FRC17_001748 [Serendipita sp. 399]|nr:hypothetical protein FRC17_001748 [Serendipita sp. 399]
MRASTILFAIFAASPALSAPIPGGGLLGGVLGKVAGKAEKAVVSKVTHPGSGGLHRSQSTGDLHHSSSSPPGHGLFHSASFSHSTDHPGSHTPAQPAPLYHSPSVHSLSSSSGGSSIHIPSSGSSTHAPSIHSPSTHSPAHDAASIASSHKEEKKTSWSDHASNLANVANVAVTAGVNVRNANLAANVAKENTQATIESNKEIAAAKAQ